MGLVEEWRAQEIRCEGIIANDATASGPAEFDFPIQLSEAPNEAWLRSFHSALGRYDFLFRVDSRPGDARLWLRGVPAIESKILAAYTDVARCVADANPQYQRERQRTLDRFLPLINAAKRIEKESDQDDD